MIRTRITRFVAHRASGNLDSFTTQLLNIGISQHGLKA